MTLVVEQEHGSQAQKPIVYFDGACPLCRREISFYERQSGGETIEWVDVSGCDDNIAADLDRPTAQQRFHLRRRDGELISGAAAFAELWMQLPRFKNLGRIVALPGVGRLAEWTYLGFLKVRPALQKWLGGDRTPGGDQTLNGDPKDEASPMPAWLMEDLRTDHAGETGAVAIYGGILAISRDPALLDFARRHRATEQGHLDALGEILPHRHRTRLLPVWRLAGWLTGALPALVGTRAVHATIDAVETFVDVHYQEQIERLDTAGICPDVRDLLEKCRLEEVEHRDEARELHGQEPHGALAAWGWTVDRGSRLAVWLSRRI